ncbi:MAG: PAC2 family protein [Chloroflexi bacterium]|nr:PAC2 family protein [Chloroflexota bacterium]
MERVQFLGSPNLQSPIMLLAFAGWPDAAEGATSALSYLARKLPAQRFASLDPEEFYVFTERRPVSSVNPKGEREVTWPANDFYAYETRDHILDLLICVGVEPNLKWRAYANAIVEVAQRFGVTKAIMLGALLDSVPHTRPIRISGGAMDEEMAKRLGAMGVRGSGYQGPTGIGTAVSQAFLAGGIRFGSIWGHSPHYIQVAHFPKVSLALLESLQEALGTTFDLEEMRASEASFGRQFQQALDKDDEVLAYVQRLERRYDAAQEQEAAIPSPQEMVQELEQFLRGRRKQEGA